MAFDFGRAERIKRQAPGRSLERRADEELPFIGDVAVAGGALLLDTCVYLHQAQGRTPDAVDQMIDLRVVNHSMVAVGELMFGVGLLREDDPRTPNSKALIEEMVREMPEHRLHMPDADVMGRAAVLAGMLGRTQGYANDDKMKAFNDCLLFLQAEKLGLTLMSANVAEFDILLQIRPKARVLLYRALQVKRAA